MNKEPETYEEILRKKRCIDLTRHYNLTMENLEEIYDFLEKNPDGLIRGNSNGLYLSTPDTTNSQQIIYTTCKNPNIRGLLLNQKGLTIFPLIIDTYRSSGSRSSRGSSSGFSSNNNNNNNTNNNNNNNNR